MNWSVPLEVFRRSSRPLSSARWSAAGPATCTTRCRRSRPRSARQRGKRLTDARRRLDEPSKQADKQLPACVPGSTTTRTAAPGPRWKPCAADRGSWTSSRHSRSAALQPTIRWRAGSRRSAQSTCRQPARWPQPSSGCAPTTTRYQHGGNAGRRRPRIATLLTRRSPTRPAIAASRAGLPRTRPGR